MTKEEYLAEIKDIEANRKNLYLREWEAKQKYLEANRQFNLNDKVLVTYEDGHTIKAFIDGCIIHANGNLGYPLKAVKRNGMKSNNRPTFYNEDKKSIELIEPAKTKEQ